MNPIHTLEQYKLHLEMNQKSKETIRSYHSATKLFLEYLQRLLNGPVSFDSIKEEHLEQYLYYLQKERAYKPASINLQLNAIRNFFKFACKKAWITVNPAEYVASLKNSAKRRDFLTAEEIHQLLNAIDHKLARLIVMTLAYTGLRIKECLSLTMEDVDFEHNKIYVRNGKGNKPRTVPLAATLKPHLEAYVQGTRRFIKSEQIFATTKTGKFSPVYVNRLLKEAVEKLGWEKHITAHSLRHSFASLLVKKDVALPTVAALLGHADFRTVTSVYVHVDDSALEDAVNELNL